MELFGPEEGEMGYAGGKGFSLGGRLALCHALRWSRANFSQRAGAACEGAP